MAASVTVTVQAEEALKSFLKDLVIFQITVNQKNYTYNYLLSYEILKKKWIQEDNISRLNYYVEWVKQLIM